MSKSEPSVDSSPKVFGKNVFLHGLLILGCMVVLTLCAAEVLLRIIGFSDQPVANGKLTADAHRFDPEIGWSLKPNVVTQNISTNRTVSVQQNSLGLRERELSDIAPDRILFLGDSFTWVLAAFVLAIGPS
jgi:hypothetical protein